jgi:hypothetical protein
MSGSAILKPSIQPGYGCFHDDSTIAGRTIETRMSAAASTTAASPRALVKV